MTIKAGRLRKTRIARGAFRSGLECVERIHAAVTLPELADRRRRVACGTRVAVAAGNLRDL